VFVSWASPHDDIYHQGKATVLQLQALVSQVAATTARSRYIPQQMSSALGRPVQHKTEVKCFQRLGADLQNSGRKCCRILHGYLYSSNLAGKEQANMV
jgi:hypothetical protein